MPLSNLDNILTKGAVLKGNIPMTSLTDLQNIASHHNRNQINNI